MPKVTPSSPSRHSHLIDGKSSSLSRLSASSDIDHSVLKRILCSGILHRRQCPATVTTGQLNAESLLYLQQTSTVEVRPGQFHVRCRSLHRSSPHIVSPVSGHCVAVKMSVLLSVCPTTDQCPGIPDTQTRLWSCGITWGQHDIWAFWPSSLVSCCI